MVPQTLKTILHIKDVYKRQGNMCAGVGFAPVISMGSRLKEILLRCNEAIAGNRFLRGLIVPGGVKYDLTESLCTELTVALTKVENEYNDIVQIIACLLYTSSNALRVYSRIQKIL